MLSNDFYECSLICDKITVICYFQITMITIMYFSFWNFDHVWKLPVDHHWNTLLICSRTNTSNMFLSLNENFVCLNQWIKGLPQMVHGRSMRNTASANGGTCPNLGYLRKAYNTTLRADHVFVNSFGLLLIVWNTFIVIGQVLFRCCICVLL